jgi:3-methyladenine DNA glycosylase AlkC
MPTERKLLKDYFDREAASFLAGQIRAVWTDFPRARFMQESLRQIEALEFHDRVRQFSEALRSCLPGNVPAALDILTRSLPPPMVTTDCINEGWRQWPLGQFIADHGTEHFEESFAAMMELTQRFTAEFAVRPFLAKEPGRTLDRLQSLVNHPNPHVRRWCSEGTRPRLPWGKSLPPYVKEPLSVWPMLEVLREDEEEYVRRSVANHLNDLSKTHPDLLIARLRGWKADGGKHLPRLLDRSLRSLIKAGHAPALALVGVQAPTGIEAQLEVLPRRVAIGEKVLCRATLQNRGRRGVDLLIDYQVQFVRRQRGTGAKVFKWTKLHLPAGGEVMLEKNHPMQKTTVRALYAGIHTVTLQVNGQGMAGAEFTLCEKT